MGVYQRLRDNMRAARLNRREIAGSFGDLGLFIPLLVGMSATNGLDFAAALFFAGLFNVATGLLYPVPMAVQPMKAIAAIAIAQKLSPSEIVAAGAIVSAAVLLLGLTGLIGVVNRLIPKPVVRGLQLSIGLTLVMKGVQLIVGTNEAFGVDSYLTAGLAAIVALVLLPSRSIPAAIVLFVGGVIATLVHSPDSFRAVSVSLWHPSFAVPSQEAFLSALPKAALPQIPLTTLNSVVAVCALCGDLFPKATVSVRSVSISVGLMNLIGCGFGAMPMCHGAGGVAGQYQFGARTNGSILFLGSTKMLLAILFGATLMSLCDSFPKSILGVMLAMSGIELAHSIKDQTDRTDMLIALATAGLCLGFNHVGIGLAVSLPIAFLLLRQRKTAILHPQDTSNVIHDDSSDIRRVSH